MNPLQINDMWFKTNLSLRELNDKLQAQFEHYEKENEWQWITTYYPGYMLNISRSHRYLPENTFTRVFSLRNMSDNVLSHTLLKTIP